MNQEVLKLLTDVVDATPEQRIKLGKDNLYNLMAGFKQYGFSEKQITIAVMNLTKLFVSADLNCSEPEYQFFCEVTGAKITRDYFFEMTNNGRDPKFVEDTLDFISHFREEEKIATLMYGVALMCSDRKVHLDEEGLVEAILDL